MCILFNLKFSTGPIAMHIIWFNNRSTWYTPWRATSKLFVGNWKLWQPHRSNLFERLSIINGKLKISYLASQKAILFLILLLGLYRWPWTSTCGNVRRIESRQSILCRQTVSGHTGPSQCRVLTKSTPLHIRRCFSR